MYIDSHCHLESFARRGDLNGVLERAHAAGVERLLTIGTSPEDWPIYRQLAADHPTRIAYTVGLHPSDVDGAWPEAVGQLEACFEQNPTPVALGEIGLDRFRLPKEEAQRAEIQQWQRAAFAAQLDIAQRRQCPVVVHSRAAFTECLAQIDASGVDWAKVVFHCFTEDADAVRQLNERGGRASFTGIATYKNGEAIRQAARQQGMDRLMIETDAPYLAPEPHRGKPNEPALVVHTARRLAEVLDVSVETLARRTSENACAFFGLG